MANFLQLIQEISLAYSNDTSVQVWADIDPDTQGLMMQELNNSCRDIWQNYNYLFSWRDNITMTCVAGQFQYDIPFDGKLKQDGLLLQPLNQDFTSTQSNKVILRHNENTEKFYISDLQQEPKEYCIFGNQLLLRPIPDKPYVLTCLYKSNKWARSVTLVDTVSNSGQKVLSVVSTVEFSVGDILYINRYTSTEETGVIDTIQAGVSLTLVGNLTFTHQVNERVIKEKQSLNYENDEPNWDIEFHRILVTHVLTILFYIDPVRQQLYSNRFNTKLQNMISESKRSQDGGQRLITTKTRW